MMDQLMSKHIRIVSTILEMRKCFWERGWVLA